MNILVLDSTAIAESGAGSAAYFSQPTIKFLRDAGHVVTVMVEFNKSICQAADVVWSEWCNEAAVQASHADCVKLVLRMRGYDAWGSLDQINWSAVSALVYESVLLKEIAETRLPTLQNFPSHVIPAGLDLSRFPFAPMDHGKVVAMPTRPDFLKGHQIVYEWARRRSDMQIHITVPFADLAPRLVRYLQYNKPINVRLWGNVDTPTWLREIKANYVLSASASEDLGYTIIEAMAMGIKPLIHDRVGARALWPEDLIWQTLDNLDKLVDPGSDYLALAWRRFVEEYYDAEKLTKNFTEVLFSGAKRSPDPRLRRVLTTSEELRTEFAVALNLVTSDPLSAEAEQAVEQFRAKTWPVDEFSEDRGSLAVALAKAWVERGIYFSDRAELWALRALQGGPRVDALQVLGDVSMLRYDLSGAVKWYRAAGLDVGELLHRTLSPARVLPLRLRPNEEVDHALVVYTSPRSPAFLEQTLTSMEAAGVARWRGPKFICADGYSPEVALGWKMLTTGSVRSGQAKSFFGALHKASEIAGLRYVTLFEDDMILCKNALDIIARVEINQDYVLLNWYTSKLFAQPRKGNEPYVWTMPLTLYGNIQAATYPIETVRRVLASDAAKTMSVGGNIGFDFFARVFPGKLCGNVYPNLVQHMGGVNSAVSPMGAGSGNVSATFAGEDFDALSLCGG